ncbi:MAG: adenylate cyclase, partial [Myxococcota bacterium]
DADGKVSFRRTVKLGKGIRRAEFEESLEPPLFTRLWALTEGCRVEKRRYRVDEGNLTWEVDDFSDRALVLCEVELPHEEHPVTLPEWLAPLVVREVTGDPEYVNLHLAK